MQALLPAAEGMALQALCGAGMPADSVCCQLMGGSPVRLVTGQIPAEDKAAAKVFS